MPLVTNVRYLQRGRPFVPGNCTGPDRPGICSGVRCPAQSLAGGRRERLCAIVWAWKCYISLLKNIKVYKLRPLCPLLLLITTSSVLAILRTSARRCLASEYVYTFIIFYSKIVIPISLATLFMPMSRVSRGLRRFSAHSKKYASYFFKEFFFILFNIIAKGSIRCQFSNPIILWYSRPDRISFFNGLIAFGFNNNLVIPGRQPKETKTIIIADIIT